MQCLRKYLTVPSIACLMGCVLALLLDSSRAAVPKLEVKDVYLDKCSVCHGADGAGKTAKGKKLKLKDLRSTEVQKKSDAELYAVIAKGKGKDMDGYEKELGKETVKELVSYVRGLAKEK